MIITTLMSWLFFLALVITINIGTLKIDGYIFRGSNCHFNVCHCSNGINSYQREFVSLRADSLRVEHIFEGLYL